MQHFTMTIDGQRIDTDEKFAVINPAKGQHFATCALATLNHVDDAVKAARAAFPEWSQREDSERQQLMHEIAQMLEANMPELAQLITQETGKPLGGLNGVGANMELMGSIGWSHVTADIELPVEVIQDNDEAYVQAYRKPLGVVASITPWNWPLMIAIWHVIAALRVGNTVVIKPSENSPLSTARFVELANKILPPGVLNVVTGFGDLGQALVSHDDVNKVVFTGSTATGKKIMASASNNLKRLTLELGGNDAAIVLSDVDVKAVAPELFGAAFHNNGQTCACLKRLYVHEDIYDALCQELALLATQVKVGDGLENDTQLGPLQNEAQLELVIALAASIENSDGRILAGGSRIDREGFFFEPTIVAGLTNGDPLVDQEQFGPILPVIKFTDAEHGLALANDNPNGLGGSVWSANSEIASELAQRMECGTAWVNSHGDVQPDAPFGGVKQSGIGVEFGRYGLEECTSLHTLKIKKG
jgi:acyl-CoA reductase-like NAD-dependent aldehyde dehydrogenase